MCLTECWPPAPAPRRTRTADAAEDKYLSYYKEDEDSDKDPLITQASDLTRLEEALLR